MLLPCRLHILSFGLLLQEEASKQLMVDISNHELHVTYRTEVESLRGGPFYYAKIQPLTNCSVLSALRQRLQQARRLHGEEQK
eukprot:6214578-Pleurochrysis_carterae.AAC.2